MKHNHDTTLLWMIHFLSFTGGLVHPYWHNCIELIVANILTWPIYWSGSTSFNIFHVTVGNKAVNDPFYPVLTHQLNHHVLFSWHIKSFQCFHLHCRFTALLSYPTSACTFSLHTWTVSNLFQDFKWKFLKFQLCSFQLNFPLFFCTVVKSIATAISLQLTHA